MREVRSGDIQGNVNDDLSDFDYDRADKEANSQRWNRSDLGFVRQELET